MSLLLLLHLPPCDTISRTYPSHFPGAVPWTAIRDGLYCLHHGDDRDDQRFSPQSFRDAEVGILHSINIKSKWQQSAKQTL